MRLTPPPPYPRTQAVASPIYASTGSRWAAMKWCLLSSACEPIAAIVFGHFASAYLTPFLLAALNAGVAGIMVCLCLIELIPAACEHVSPRVSVRSGQGPG
jgi:zinc transporter, ZIP family